jgi:hypothetical protein
MLVNRFWFIIPRPIIAHGDANDDSCRPATLHAYVEAPLYDVVEGYRGLAALIQRQRQRGIG